MPAVLTNWLSAHRQQPTFATKSARFGAVGDANECPIIEQKQISCVLTFWWRNKNQNRQVTGFIGEPAGFKPATRPL
jgi:hypothetical protein